MKLNFSHLVPRHFTNSISPGFQVFSDHGSSDLSRPTVPLQLGGLALFAFRLCVQCPVCRPADTLASGLRLG